MLAAAARCRVGRGATDRDRAPDASPSPSTAPWLRLLVRYEASRVRIAPSPQRRSVLNTVVRSPGLRSLSPLRLLASSPPRLPLPPPPREARRHQSPTCTLRRADHAGRFCRRHRVRGPVAATATTTATMVQWHSYNPFAKRESHSAVSIRRYRALTLLSWALSVVSSVYYTVHEPHDGYTIRRRIWDQNYLYPSAFTMHHIVGEVYWVGLFVLQFGYIAHLFSWNADTVHHAASVGSHFIVNNLLHFAFVMLFVRSHFHWAELVLVVNFLNLSWLHVRHNTYARFIHAPTVTGPLAWTFVAILWNGALMVPHPHSLAARILGNIFIWSILAYGMVFIVIFNDYTMAFALSVLSAAIGAAQFKHQAIALQWIFAFVIMAILFILTVLVAVPTWTGRDLRWRRAAVTDQERAPLLNE
ncbi:DUF1774-domain-containing protein [Tolypocladium capitatum]|uniref:DUF1774-domain-containing protein n=1 Tax=Tolypocladium capitatum TaxID=45235 RepID=A0A2K3QLM1_9HYPO|nr:DUF1774-domain-containing protein [Tolypocladium capitatum]